MRIVLVDDHPIVRKGLRSLLTAEHGYDVIAEAGTGADAVRLLCELKPDAGIVDLKLPDMSGIEVAAAAKKGSPETRIIMLSMHASGYYIEQAFQAGADGYVVKDVLEQEIIEALQSVKAGKRYLGTVPDSLNSSAPLPADRLIGDPFTQLTSREKEVFQCIVEGKQNKEIAQRLDIGVRTVETHRENIMKKFGVHSAAELIHYTYKNNIGKSL
jgi:DNA-binding NarL/FixJ family response regulator